MQIYNVIVKKNYIVKFISCTGHGEKTKFVKELRNGIILVTDSNGNVEKYRKVEEAKPKRKIPTKTKESVSKTATQTKPCSVIIENLTPDDITKINAEIKRDFRVEKIQQKIAKLPCKNFG